MIRNFLKAGLSMFVLAIFLCFAANGVMAETLNPSGVNPHAEAPRKRITQEQKNAAYEAKKKKKAEIDARKAAKKSEKVQPALLPESK